MLLPVMLFTDHTTNQFSWLLVLTVLEHHTVMAVSGFADSADIAGVALRLQLPSLALDPATVTDN